MKKLLILVILAALLLVGCESNASGAPGNYQFNIIHISDNAGNCADCRVQTWYTTDQVGIEILLADGNSVFCSEGTYILAKDYCPICGRK